MSYSSNSISTTASRPTEIPSIDGMIPTAFVDV